MHGHRRLSRAASPLLVLTLYLTLKMAKASAFSRRPISTSSLQNDSDCVGYFEVNQSGGWCWGTATVGDQKCSGCICLHFLMNLFLRD